MRSVIPILSLLCAVVAQSCFYDPDLSKISEEPTETPGTAMNDGSGHGDAGDDEYSGLGTPCDADSDDCDGFDADYCLADPTNPDTPGMCTVRDCDEKGCPDAYLCCDCSGVGMEVMCVPDDFAETVSAFCSCS